MFFAAADQLSYIDTKKYTKFLVIRMRSVPAIDASAMRALNQLADRTAKKRIRLIFSHVNEQPLSVMKKDGFYDRVGAECFQPNIVDAIRYAESQL